MKQAVFIGFIAVVISLLIMALYYESNVISGDEKQLVIDVEGEEVYAEEIKEDEEKYIMIVEEKDDILVLENEEIIDYYDLDPNTTLNTIDYQAIAKKSGEDADFNVIYQNGMSVEMYEANCKNRVCVKQGEISIPGESITCVPHQTVVKIKGTGVSDA